MILSTEITSLLLVVRIISITRAKILSHAFCIYFYRLLPQVSTVKTANMFTEPAKSAWSLNICCIFMKICTTYGRSCVPIRVTISQAALLAGYLIPSHSQHLIGKLVMPSSAQFPLMSRLRPSKSIFCPSIFRQ